MWNDFARQRFFHDNQRNSQEHFLNNRKAEQADQLTPIELWYKHRPLQGYLDTVTPKEKERLLNCSRRLVFDILASRREPGVRELRGNELYPLGLKLD